MTPNTDNLEARFSEIILKLNSQKDFNVFCIKASNNFCTLIQNFEESIQLHNIRSISKIVIPLCYGILADNIKKEGSSRQLTLDSNIASLFTGNKFPQNMFKQKFGNIKLRHFLTNTVGYEKELLFSKDITANEEGELLTYLFDEELKYKPGEHFVYSNASSYLLSAIFQEFTGINISDFAYQNLFTKLGIANFKWGNYGAYCKGGTGLYLDINDLHKIGQLILNEGIWENQQIVSREWIKLISTPQVFKFNKDYSNDPLSRKAYGLFLWISNSNTYFINGHMGQYLVIAKDKGIVVSILANTENGNDLATYLNHLIS